MDEIIKTLQKMADIAELRGVKIFYKALSEQYKAVAAYVIKYGIDRALGDADFIIKEDDMKAAFIKYYEFASLPVANYQYKLLKDGEKSISSSLRGWLRQITEFIFTRSSTMITNITDTTREDVRKVLNEAKQEGLGAREGARRLTERNKTFSKSRALLITRTEGTRAASQGAKMASDQWKRETGQPRYKKWVSIIDKITRPDHVEADGQFVPDDQMFNVNGTLMEYPGDENAPANETCNCRCRVIYMSKRMAMRLQQSLAA